MKSIKNLLPFIFIILFANCSTNNEKTKIVTTSDYELRLATNHKEIIILFPCFFCDIEHTKKEAIFLKDLDKEGISTLILNENQKLFLKDEDKKKYNK